MTPDMPTPAPAPTSAPEHGPEAMPEGIEAPPRGVRVAAVVRWFLVLGAFAMAIGAIGHTRGWFGTVASDGRRYTCPMHPDIQADHPGECPICHMDLVPIEDVPLPAAPADEPAPIGLAPITVSAPTLAASGVRTAAVEATTLAPALTVIATVEAREQGRARVDARFAGWLDRLTVGAVGERVGKGQVIARIVSPELATAQQDYLSARALAAGRPDEGALVGGARRRLELLGLTAADLATLDRTGAPLPALEVRAPVGGTVVARPAVVGAYLEPGTPIVEIADLSTVWVTAEIYELDLARVRTGQAATIRVAGLAERRWTGTIAQVLPTVDPTTRAGQARIAVANRDRALVPGMAAEVDLALPPVAGLAVPRSAVVDTGREQYVFVAGPDGRFDPRLVVTGATAGEQIAIVRGLTAGERVVTVGTFALDSESRIRASQAPSTEHPH